MITSELRSRTPLQVLPESPSEISLALLHKNRNLSELLLNVTQVSKILGFSPWSIWRMCRRNIISHIKLTKKYRFKRSTIESWIADKMKKSMVRPGMSMNCLPGDYRKDGDIIYGS